MRKSVLALTLLVVSTALFATGRSEQDSDPAGAARAPFEQRLPVMTWQEIVDEARGSELFWYMWGGSDSINRFVQGYVADRLLSEYEITLEMVPVTDASIFVSQVLGERQAGRLTGGSVDVMWINGENFRSMKENGLLFGPYAEKLPNLQYVDTNDPTIANDFGFPVDGYESPYGSAQMVMVYDQARVPEPPRTIPALLAWIRENPGRFTYPAPPDFTGSAFVRHIFYYAAGGYQNLLGPFDQGLFDEIAADAWAILNELEPYLWRQGRTYPESITQQQGLFANQEVDFGMNYNPSAAANLVSQGRYPESTRTFVFDGGTIGNTHYLAIPFNASNKPAAMVLANLVLDPAVQFEKALPQVWGDLPVVSVSRLPQQWQDAFRDLPRPPSVLPPSELQRSRLPELQSTWLESIERGWIGNVLQQ